MSSDNTNQSCQLTGVSGIIIQIVLGTLSFSVLIYKRYREQPKRAWKIWAMDTSKQGVSQMLAHIINIIISISLSSTLDSDACIWYLTTNILDNTLGVFFSIGVLMLIQKYLFTPNYIRFQSGNYYSIIDQYEQQKSFAPPSQNMGSIKPLQITKRKTIYAISYFDWFMQFIVWNIIVVITKTILFQLQILLSAPLITISMFLIGWIQPYETLQLILVIIVVPVIMNGLAFWIQDNFLKKKTNAIIIVQDKKQNKQDKRDSEITRQQNILKNAVQEPLL